MTKKDFLEIIILFKYVKRLNNKQKYSCNFLELKKIKLRIFIYWNILPLDVCLFLEGWSRNERWILAKDAQTLMGLSSLADQLAVIKKLTTDGWWHEGRVFLIRFGRGIIILYQTKRHRNIITNETLIFTNIYPVLYTVG